MNKQTREAVAEVITYRIIATIDHTALEDVEADVLRTVARALPDMQPQVHIEECHRILLRAWKMSGSELLREMAEKQEWMLPPSMRGDEI